MPHEKFRNTFLSHLGHDSIDRLQLRPVTFEVMHELEFPGSPIQHLFFIESGIASMTVTFRDGAQVEVTIFGYESVIGISALMGTRRSLNRVYTQLAGHGFSCTLAHAQEEFQRGDRFQLLALRYVQAQLVQTMQSAACNARHQVDERLARWLLICADRADTSTLRLSQELLSIMLGASRPTVSLGAAKLREAGLITYASKAITITDIARLEAHACECYRIIKDHLDNYAEFDIDFLS